MSRIAVTLVVTMLTTFCRLLISAVCAPAAASCVLMLLLKVSAALVRALAMPLAASAMAAFLARVAVAMAALTTAEISLADVTRLSPVAPSRPTASRNKASVSASMLPPDADRDSMACADWIIVTRASERARAAFKASSGATTTSIRLSVSVSENPAFGPSTERKPERELTAVDAAVSALAAAVAAAFRSARASLMESKVAELKIMPSDWKICWIVSGGSFTTPPGSGLANRSAIFAKLPSAMACACCCRMPVAMASSICPILSARASKGSCSGPVSFEPCWPGTRFSSPPDGEGGRWRRTLPYCCWICCAVITMGGGGARLMEAIETVEPAWFRTTVPALLEITTSPTKLPSGRMVKLLCSPSGAALPARAVPRIPMVAVGVLISMLSGPVLAIWPEMKENAP